MDSHSLWGSLNGEIGGGFLPSDPLVRYAMISFNPSILRVNSSGDAWPIAFFKACQSLTDQWIMKQPVTIKPN